MNGALEQVLSKGQQLKEPPHLFGVAAWHLSHVSQGKSEKKAMQVQMVQHGAAVCTFCMSCDAFIDSLQGFFAPTLRLFATHFGLRVYRDL